MKVEHFNASGGIKETHWKVLLWPDIQSFNTKVDIPGKPLSLDGNFICSGMHHPHPYYQDTETGEMHSLKVIGIIHFVRDKWDMEVVAHECGHAMAHYIRATGKNPLGDKRDNMEEEEELCYPFGRLVEEIYTKLWVLNPNPNWVKEKEE